MTRILRYSELRHIERYEDRYEYLRLGGGVGVDTFGYDRFLNQQFYRSSEWRHVRNVVIARDNGCDMGVEGYEIIGRRIHIHHMNPMTVMDITNHSDVILDPEYLISVTQQTHNAIHYGTSDILVKDPVQRRPGDTTLW